MIFRKNPHRHKISPHKMAYTAEIWIDLAVIWLTQVKGLTASPNYLFIVFLSVFSVVQASGRSSRRASESSTHSGGRERSNSAVKQVSPPPPSIPEQPCKEEAKKAKKDSPEKVHVLHFGSQSLVFNLTVCNVVSFFCSQKSWIFWPFGKRKNEAHLPDDKNPSVSCFIYIYYFLTTLHIKCFVFSVCF